LRIVAVAFKTCVEVDRVGFTAAFKVSVGATVRVVAADTGPSGAKIP
jgi:hypothetical protein